MSMQQILIVIPLTVLSRVADLWFRFWPRAEAVDGLHFNLKRRKGLGVVDHKVIVGNFPVVPFMSASHRLLPEHFILEVGPIMVPFVHFLKNKTTHFF